MCRNLNVQFQGQRVKLAIVCTKPHNSTACTKAAHNSTACTKAAHNSTACTKAAHNSTACTKAAHYKSKANLFQLKLNSIKTFFYSTLIAFLC